MEKIPTVNYVYAYIYPVLSKISAWFAFFVILSMIGLSKIQFDLYNNLITNWPLGIYDFKLVDRVSLRLQVAISFYDLWLHTLPMWARPYQIQPSSMCTFISWQFIFCPTLYTLFNVAIGLNLQLVFFKNIHITKKIEIAYWLSAIAIGLIFSIPPLCKFALYIWHLIGWFIYFLVLGKLGWAEANGCFVTEENESYGKMLDFFAIILPTIIAMIYLSIITYLVYKKLENGMIVIRNNGLNRSSGPTSKAMEIVKKMGRRMLVLILIWFNLLTICLLSLLYPLIMIITQSGFVVSQTVFDFSPDATTYNVVLEGWSNIGGGIMGMLNFLAFCSDPMLQHAIKKIYNRIKSKSISTLIFWFCIKLLLDPLDDGDDGFTITSNPNNRNDLPNQLEFLNFEKRQVALIIRSL